MIFIPPKIGKAQKEKARKERRDDIPIRNGRSDADVTSELFVDQKVTLSSWLPGSINPGKIVEIDEYPDEAGNEAKRYHVKWPRSDGRLVVMKYRRQSLQPNEKTEVGN